MKKNNKIEILKKYYKIDEKKKEIEVDLYFENFSSLINNNFGNNNVEKLNEIMLEEIQSAFKELPLTYKINLVINIENLENYKPKEVEKIILDNLVFKQYIYKKLHLKKSLTSLLMTLFGAGLITVSYLTSSFSQIPQIISDLINISGTLLVWEASYLFFIDRTDQKYLARQYATKLKTLTVKNKNYSSTQKIEVGLFNQ